jgi:O-antigen/teichoic acid export membrane protein
MPSTAIAEVSTPVTTEKSVRGNFIWTSAGNAVYAACQWGMVSVLAKLGSAEIVGEYALGVAIATPVLMLAQLNLRSVLATDVVREHRFRDYRNLRAVSLVLALLAVAVIAFSGHRGAEAFVIVLVGMALALEWASDVYHGLLQQQDHMERIAVSMAARGVLSLATLAVVLVSTGSLIAALSGVLIARLAVLVLFDSTFATWDCAEPRAPEPAGMRQPLRILYTAFPLGVVLMLGSLTINIPRYFIAQEMGTHALGIYSAIASITMAGNLLVNALGQAATPRLARLYSEANRAGVKRLSLQLCALGIVLGGCGWAVCALIGRRVLALCFGPEYAAHNDLLMMLALSAAAAFVASLLGYAITACRRFREQMPLQLASVMATAAGCFLLIPRFGLIGAAIGFGAGPLVQAIGELLVLRAALRGEHRAAVLPEAVRSAAL